MESGRLLTRAFRPFLFGAVFGFAFGYGLVPVFASGSELIVKIQPGIDPMRNYQLEDHWTTQLARSLPPENSPYVLIIQGPDKWISEERPQESPGEIGVLNAEHAEVLRTAMAEKDLFSASDPLLLAGRVVALLRPMESDGRTAPTRHARFWPLWKVLAYSSDADTLSAALGAVQVLEGANIDARIARYPAASGKVRYGVLILGVIGDTREVPWGKRMGSDLLLPVAFSAAPVTDLQPDDLKSWTWQEVLAQGWDGVSLASKGDGAKDGPIEPRPAAGASPDLCKQAEALGFECVPVDSGANRAQTLLILSTLTLILLGGWLGLRFNLHRLRLLKARIRRMAKEERRF